MNIVILGTHRSGTSAVTRLVNMMGAHVGNPHELIGGAEDNPEGFWERHDVVACNDAILAHFGCSWDKLAAWESRKGALPAAIITQMQAVISALNAHSIWVMKDPRFCLTLDYWLPYLQSPVVVRVLRDPIEVAASLKTRNDAPMLAGLALWECYTRAMLRYAAPAMVLDYAMVVSRPVETCHALYNALTAAHINGLRLPEAAEVERFIQPRLYRSKSTAEQQALLLPQQKTLAEAAHGEGDAGRAPMMMQEALAFYDALQSSREEVTSAAEREVTLQALLRIRERERDHFKFEMKGAAAELQAIKASRSWRLAQFIAKLKFF